MKIGPFQLLCLCLCPLPVWAAEPATVPAVMPTATTLAAPAPVHGAVPAQAAASGTAPATALVPGEDVAGREPIEPNVQHIVIEGENTRVEELRVRGQTQSVTVKNKAAPTYEIVIGDGSRDLSSGAGAQKGAAGQRVWRVLSF